MTELSLHILDIVQNSISAKAETIEIHIHEDTITNLLTIEIKDNGSGMDDETVSKVTDPYFTSRTTRKVGMGIPLFKLAAEQCNGCLSIKSTVGVGTVLTATFEINHFDRQPMGDIAGIIVMLASTNLTIRFIFSYKTTFGEFLFDTNEINCILENVSISNPEVMKYLKEMINENLVEINSNK